MEKEELEILKINIKQIKKMADSSWSGDERVVVQTAIFIQLQRIGNILESKK